MTDRSKHPYLPACDIAAVHTGLGNKKEALRWLNQAYEDRSGPIYMLNVMPVWKPLRSEPEFETLRRKLNLTNE